MAASNPQLRQLLDSNPQLRAMMSNPQVGIRTDLIVDRLFSYNSFES